jgi:hypothetical protein
MDSPAHTKRKHTDSNYQPHRRIINNEEEAEELEEVDSKSDGDEGDGQGDLAHRDTILISKLKPKEYANTVSQLPALRWFWQGL